MDIYGTLISIFDIYADIFDILYDTTHGVFINVACSDIVPEATIAISEHSKRLIGLLETIDNLVTPELKDENDLVVVLGSLNVSLGGSTYLNIIENQIIGPLSSFEKEIEFKVQKLCFKAMQKNIIKSAHDLSDGGLSVLLAEMILQNDSQLGIKIDIETNLSNLEKQIRLTFLSCSWDFINNVLYISD